MALSDEQWQAIADKTGCIFTGDMKDAIEAEVRKQDTTLIRQLVEALESAKPVHATSKNTHAVRVGYDIGGYVKHYAIPFDVVQKLVAAGRARLEGKP